MPVGSSRKKEVNKLLWRIHHWVGLYAGIVIGVLSITGALAVFIPEIDTFIKRTHYKASSSASPDGHPAFSRSLAQVTGQHPNFKNLSVDLPNEDGDVAEIKLLLPQPGKGGSETVAFFVDVGRDSIVGSRIHQNSFANYMRQMHVRLYDGYWGRQLVGLAGIALLVLVVTGLIIYGNFMKRQAWPTIRRGRGLRIVLADWHKILGIAALSFNLVIAVTGAWLGLQPVLMKWLNIELPNRFEAPDVMDKEADKRLTVDWQKALQVAKTSFPDLESHYISSSVNGSATITFRGSIKGTVYERGANTLVLSKETLAPVFKYDVRKQSPGAKFYFVQEALHFGDFGGIALKVLYAALGLISGFLSISGFAVYVLRKKKKQHPGRRPLKRIAAYSLLIVFILSVAALISLFVGYAHAALMMAIIINGSLALLIVFFVVRFILSRLGRM